jgi:hypothetical protein
VAVLSAALCAVVVKSLRCLRWILNGIVEEEGTSIG